jgi:uracil-DNA glycosylase
MEGFQEKVGEHWYQILKEEFSKEYFINLGKWISYTRESKTIYPESEDVFRAFKLTPFNKVKVVILGQDPYYNGQADGLAFSYKDGESLGNTKQSLDILWEEMERDVQFGLYLSFDKDLEWLAEQGVFLLNTVLTVFRNQANSHANKGWEKFTMMSLYMIMKHHKNIVFLLWGSKALQTYNKVAVHFPFNENNHFTLEAPHPAADLYKRDGLGMVIPDYPNTFAGCGHFSKCNQILKEHNIEEIRW